MSVENGIIREPISAKDPYVALGLGSYNGVWDIGWACSNLHNKTNNWSRYKPVNYDSPIEIPKVTRDAITGFYKENYNIGPFVIPILKPDETIHEWYRLTDWIGYNHYAKPFKGEIQKVDYDGAPAGTDCYIPTGNDGDFNVNITLPEIPIRKFKTDLGEGYVEVVRLNNTTKEQLGRLSLSGVTDEQYETLYANKTKQLSCKISVPGVTPGILTPIDIYLMANNAMFISQEYSKMILNVYKKFQQNPNDPTQWLNADVVIDLSGSVIPDRDEWPNYIKYSSFKYLMRRDPDNIVAFEFQNLWSGLSGYSVTILYQPRDGDNFIEILRLPRPQYIEDTKLWTTSNGATFLNDKKYVSQYVHQLPGGPVSVTCANATLALPAGTISNDRIKISYSSL